MAARLERVHVMILITCAFYTTTEWYFVVPYTSLASSALLYRGLLKHWLFWTALTALMGASLAQLWLQEGNHLYLLFYLCLTALTASLFPNSSQVFACNARLIIGFVFVSAVFWKVVGPGYLSGAFFEFYLIHDERLARLALLLTDLERVDVIANQDVLAGPWTAELQFQSSSQVRRLATLLTYAGLFVETIVAVTFLAPLKVVSRYRNVTLLAFLASAYLFIPVPSFGMSLACLGYSQTEDTRFQNLYLAAFVVMPLTSLRYYLFPL